jgi:hypothetical protein
MRKPISDLKPLLTRPKLWRTLKKRGNVTLLQLAYRNGNLSRRRFVSNVEISAQSVGNPFLPPLPR